MATFTRGFIVPLIVFAFLAVNSGCNKEEGYGGSAYIRGTIMMNAYNRDMSVLQKTYPAYDLPVYIVFGDQPGYGDRVRANHEGVFQFGYLTPGDYTVYYFSDNPAEGAESKIPVEVKVNVKKNDSRVDMGTLDAVKLLDYDDGNSSITGRLLQVNFTKDFYFIIDTTFSQSEEVFIVTGDAPGYDERGRTSHDGTFRFEKLIKGEYTVFAYSDNYTGSVEKIPVKRTVVITGENQHINLGDIYLNKK